MKLYIEIQRVVYRHDTYGHEEKKICHLSTKCKEEKGLVIKQLQNIVAMKRNENIACTLCSGLK